VRADQLLFQEDLASFSPGPSTPSTPLTPQSSRRSKWAAFDTNSDDSNEFPLVYANTDHAGEDEPDDDDPEESSGTSCLTPAMAAMSWPRTPLSMTASALAQSPLATDPDLAGIHRAAMTLLTLRSHPYI
jgi:hypothetical protein